MCLALELIPSSCPVDIVQAITPGDGLQRPPRYSLGNTDIVITNPPVKRADKMAN